MPVMNSCERCGDGPSSPHHRDRNVQGFHRFRSPIMTRAETHAKEAGVDFDEAAHTYTLPVSYAGKVGQGARVESVTGVLKDNTLVDYQFCSLLARERGSAAHEAIHFFVEGDLDRSSVDPIVAPYVDAAERFLQDLEAEPVMAEAIVFSSLYGYAGKLDLLCYLRGRKRLAVIDWKTGAVPPATALQLAGYAGAWHEMTGEPVIDRIAVQLTPSHSVPYKEHPFTDRGDLSVFRGAAAVTNWRRRNVTP
jgi:hypothetical protein